MRTIFIVSLVLGGLGLIWWQGWLAEYLPARPLAATPATAVYQWTDAQGKVHYGDAPPASGKAVKANLPELTVVTMPKLPPPKPKPLPQLAQFDEEGNPITTPSRQLRNPALERMGLTD